MAVLLRPYTSWKALAILVKNTAVPAVNGGAAVAMTDSEKLWIHTACDCYPGHIVTMSNGNASINLTVVETSTVLTSATVYGDSSHYWVAPGDASAILTAAGASAYDSVHLFAPSAGVPCLYGGLTLSPGSGTYGYSFYPSAPDTVDHARSTMSLVHEWNHQEQGWYTTLGYGAVMPTLDNAAAYNDPRTGSPYNGSDNYRGFLSDVMTGSVPSGGSTIGTTLAIWRLGRPVAG